MLKLDEVPQNSHASLWVFQVNVYIYFVLQKKLHVFKSIMFIVDSVVS